MDPREQLRIYVQGIGGCPAASKKMGIPYSTLAAILNGTRGVGRNMACKLEISSAGRLAADRMIWIKPVQKAA